MIGHHMGALSLAGVIHHSDIDEISRVFTPIFDSRIRSIRFQIENGRKEFFFQYRPRQEVDTEVEEICETLGLSFAWSTVEAISEEERICRVRVCDRLLGQDMSFELEDGLFLDVPPEAEALAERWKEIDDSPPFLVAQSQHELLRLAADPEHGPAARLYLARRGQRDAKRA